MPVVQINGSELFHHEVGDGPPCLVMHGGLGFDHTHLRPWIDQLGDVLRLIYYDHRGNGRSGRPPLDTLTYEQFAADADALRVHLEVETVTVLGFSAGAAIALEYALAFPQRVNRLILVGAHPAWDYAGEIAANIERRDPTGTISAAFARASPATDAEFAELVETIMPLYYHRFDAAVNRRFVEQVVWSASANARYDDILPAFDVVDRLRDIRVPTLILVGRDDFITPVAQGERLLRGIPRADLVVFEKSGHMPYVEEPAAFAETVRAWLKTA